MPPRTRNRTTVLVGLLISSALAGTAAGAVTADTASRVDLRPAVVGFGERATVSVSGTQARALQVLLAGATDESGRQLPWRSLRHAGGAWHATLPAPALLGLYPVVLRTGADAPSLRSQQRLLRVLAPGSQARPSFGSPVEVVRWWVRAVPHATLAALKPWPRPGFDRRDLRLHRLFVVAYNPPGTTRVEDRRGMFVTAYRDGYSGRWRLLEATLEP